MAKGVVADGRQWRLQRPPLEPKGVLKGLRTSGREIQEKTVFHDFSLFSGVFDPQDPHRKIELINAHLSVGVSTL